MIPDIHTDIELDERQTRHLHNFLRSTRFLDHDYRAKGPDGIPRQVVKFHVTKDVIPEAGEYAPFPWTEQGFPEDPCIAVEDAEGNLLGLQHCDPADTSLWCAGTIVPENGTLWLFPFEKEECAPIEETPEVLNANIVRPIRIDRQSAKSLQTTGELGEEALSGEFYYSEGEENVLADSHSCMSLIPSAESTVSQERRDRAEGLLAAMKASIARAVIIEKVAAMAKEQGATLDHIETGLLPEYAGAMEANGLEMSKTPWAALDYFVTEGYSAENIVNIAGYEKTSPAP